MKSRRRARRGVQEQQEQQQEQQQEEAAAGHMHGEDGDDDSNGDREREGAPARVGARRSYADMLGSAVDDAELRTAYRKLRDKDQRASARARVADALEASAPRWQLLLWSGFNVLLHGLGSKHELLQRIAEQQLTDGAVVSCNGWAKGVTAHKVLAAAAAALLGRPCRNESSSELIAQVRQEAKQWPNRRVYVVLHNIDGPGLRNEGSQALLASLAACPNCHLLASVSHVNASLLWSTANAAAFRWVWVQAHTYTPCVAETMDMPSALLGCFQRCQQRNAGTVLKSFNHTARAIYRLIVDAQLEDPELEGLDFKQIHSKSRQAFLLTDESAVRGVLTEFLDHEMLVTRRASEGGGDLFCVPLDQAGLEHALQELDALMVA